MLSVTILSVVAPNIWPDHEGKKQSGIIIRLHCVVVESEGALEHVVLHNNLIIIEMSCITEGATKRYTNREY
jgi:hypothetical protein